MKSGGLTSRPEDPINPGGKAILTVSGTFRQGKRTNERSVAQCITPKGGRRGVGDRKSSRIRRK